MLFFGKKPRPRVPLNKDEFIDKQRNKHIVQILEHAELVQETLLYMQDFQEQLLDNVKSDQETLLCMQDLQKQLLDNASKKQDQHLEITKREKFFVKPKSKGFPRCRKSDPLEFGVFKEIMNAPKPKGVHAKSWGRFLITSAILFFSGLRLNEIAVLTEADIQQIISQKKLYIYQKKVNQYRNVRFIDKAIPYIKKAFDEYKNTVFLKDTQIFPAPSSGLQNGDKFTKLINKYLTPFSKEKNLILTSHSFRINFITSILKKNKIQDAQQIVGHRDIRSTVAYNRYKLSSAEQYKNLEDAFD